MSRNINKQKPDVIVWDLQCHASSGNGGLKPNLINMELSDQEIEQQLNSTLHKPLVADVTDYMEEHVHESPCYHFACRKGVHSKRMEQMVKSLSWALQNHNIRTGSMLVFCCAEERIPMILGVCLKKPIFHVLVKAVLDDSQVLLTNTDGQINFQSSHELMLELLRTQSPDPTNILDIEVEVWKCNSFLVSDDQGNHILKSNPENLESTFHISSKTATKNKPSTVKLPFGFEQRLQDKRKAARAKKKARANPPVRRTVTKTANTQGQIPHETMVLGQSTDALVVSSESDSAESSHEDENDKEDDHDDELTAHPVDREEESIVPMSSVVAKETEAAQSVAVEVELSNTQREEKAEQVRRKAETGYYKTVFSGELGLVSGSVAVSGRATCLRCKQKIAKDTIRFSWQHSMIKPHGWVHSNCVYKYIQESGLKDRSVQQLRKLVQEGLENPHVFNAVASEARKILALLDEPL